MYIYNSLTNKKEEFKTIEPNKVKMYVCGPTVYNFIHIGNARPVIFFDIVKRYLQHRGYEVTYVSNITDVDDKIIKAAIENKVTEQEISQKYTKAFLDDVKNLNCLPFDINPKVTDYMDEIIHYIKRLEEKGFAYEVDGDVYFSVNKIPNYGQLSNQETEHLEVGARITEHSKKENPLDFTLWKKTTTGIKWDSPWGLGRPGWHTECVAMINDTIGDLVDIHGGGSDLKFPHHENEIAQSEALTHTRLANYWMHNGRLMFNDEKMSKSLGNIITINDFLKKFDYRVLRLLMLTTHYRQPLNYNEEIINNMNNDLDKIHSTLKQVQYKLDLNNFLDDNDILLKAYSLLIKQVQYKLDLYDYKWNLEYNLFKGVEVNRICSLLQLQFKYDLDYMNIFNDNKKISNNINNRNNCDFLEQINEILNKIQYDINRKSIISNNINENVNNDLENIYLALKQNLDKLNQDSLDNNILNDEYSIQKITNLLIQFYKAMDDDFNTANAVSVLMSLIKEINKLMKFNKYSNYDLIYLLFLYKTLKIFLSVLGIDYTIERLDQETKQLIHLRDEARKNKDFVKSDEIRSKLLEKGINI